MGNVEGAGCPMARTVTLIGDRWTPLIVRDLAPGRRRFSELERSLDGISPKTLSDRLRRLEDAGVVTRACFAEMPPRVEYHLTDKGHALLSVVESMRDFGVTWLAGAQSSPQVLCRAWRPPSAELAAGPGPTWRLTILRAIPSQRRIDGLGGNRGTRN